MTKTTGTGIDATGATHDVSDATASAAQSAASRRDQEIRAELAHASPDAGNRATVPPLRRRPLNRHALPMRACTWSIHVLCRVQAPSASIARGTGRLGGRGEGAGAGASTEAWPQAKAAFRSAAPSRISASRRTGRSG